MAELARVGDFCPNSDCPDYEQVQKSGGGNITEFGHTRSGRQRYKRGTCDGTFTETRGAIFYRRRADNKEILMPVDDRRRFRVSRITKDIKRILFPHGCVTRRNMRKIF